MKDGALSLLASALLLIALPVSAQPADGHRRVSVLRELNTAVDALVQRVSPSVVQVLVTAYGPREGADRDSSLAIVRQSLIGSGVIVDPDGYIVTNAHLVTSAVQVQVVLSAPWDDQPPGRSDRAGVKTLEARVVAEMKDLDLAVLKIEATQLPALPLGNYEGVRKGDLVFALGSPSGLRGSVSMGVVSTVARQLDPDSPLVYIQTDAPINPGNSGGPLVNVDGELVGINTFILSHSGGSQGLGFAIPSSVVASAYLQLRTHGRVQHETIGVQVQGLTPALAAGLRLPRDWGVIVADLFEGGPAEGAGLRVADIITSVDGQPTTSVPLFSMQLTTHRDADHVVLGVLRGGRESLVDVPVLHVSTDLAQLSDTFRLDPKRIDPLGILALDLDDAILGLLLPSLRIPSGVVVAGRPESGDGADASLAPWDVIHAINGTAVRTMDELTAALRDLDPQRPIVLQVEREGKLTFVTAQRR